MAQVDTNGIQIEYETFGKPSSRPLLLIMGYSYQLISWDEEFCKQIAQRGHYVIRFDNRDVGLSTKIDEGGIPDIKKTFKAMMMGEEVHLPYTLEDMADDTVGLLDALAIEKAHICGLSMGGMIAQIIAINYPQRVLSLIPIYSNMGDPEDPRPKPEVIELLTLPFPEERGAYIEHNVKLLRAIAGSGFTFDEKWHREIAAQSYDRSFCPQGAVRQYAAVLTQKNRKSALASISVPTLVVHGSDDPLVPVECGRNTAAAISGAELKIIDGMGHESPHSGAWQQIIEAIADHTHKIDT
jgi:pimeloyl-ACP methyl ester carboxylesterase